MKFFVSCGKGLEYLLVDELPALGATKATATVAGANVEGELVDAQRAVLWSRLASRVLYLEHGRVLADLPVHDFFHGPLPEEARLFLKGELS